MNEADTIGSGKRTLGRRRWRLYLGVLLVLGVIVWFGGIFHREPLHKGKPIGYWVDRACTNDGKRRAGTTTADFRREVKSIGTAAVPCLVEKLRASDRSRNLQLWIRDHVPSVMGLLVPLDESVNEVRFGAARTLACLGPAAEPAVPDLVRLLPTIGSSVEALTAIGPKAKESLPALRSLLQLRGPWQKP